MMRKRFRLLGVLALVLALVMPSSAFAWDWLADGVFWRGNTSQGMYGVCVHAGNKYDAAAWVFSPGDPAMLTSEVRTKLSDPNYGGRFYEYAQTFSLMEDLTQYPEWLPAYVGVANIFVNGLAGDVNFYTSNASDSLYSGAKIDFERVLAGEDLGGGGSGGGGDSSLPSGFELWTGGSVDSDNYLYTLVSIDGGSREITVDMSRLSSSYGTGYHLAGARVYSGSSMYFRGFTLPDGVFAVKRVSDNRVFLYNSLSSSVSFTVFSTPVTYMENDGKYKPRSVDTTTGYAIAGGGLIDVWNRMSITIFAFGSAAPPPPAGVWPEPETPVTPDPPEVPTPTAPVATTEPSVSGPSVVWPEITINVEPTPEGLDYTALLTAINNNLNSLRSDLNQEFDSVISSLRNIYQYLQHLDSMLERHCKHIRDSIEDNVYELELWLKSLFEWLPEQLDYDAELNFDDSELRYLLRRILNKIPGGSNTAPTTYKPNPQADEPGFFDWLLDLWHRFLIDLVSVLPDELGGLVDAFSQLTHYFPFSIPWDLFALLLLFEHEPVTPVFQIPWGYGGGDGQTQMITIDLSAWDGVMAMVRPVFLVGFCFKLALITKDLLAGFDLSKGGV